MEDKTMKNLINELIRELQSTLIQELKSYTNDGKQIILLLLKAYNTYNEQERDGFDYLFDINDKEDLKCCIEGGLEAKDIARMYFDYKEHKHTPLFFYDVNHRTPELIATWGDVRNILLVFLEEIVANMIAYPHLYKELYEHCITNYMRDMELL